MQRTFDPIMQASQNIDYKEAYEDLQLKYEAVIHDLAQLKKMVFGSKSERFIPTDDSKVNPQLNLALDAETIAQCKITDVSKYTVIRTKTEVIANPPKAHPGRMKLPDHLRRDIIILQPEADVRGLKKIGDELTEVLNYIPGELYVTQYIRPKYVVPINDTDTTVITASLPGRLLEKCMAGEGLLAQITVDKYADHIPLHRQGQRFGRAGVNIAQTTLCGWVKLVLTNLISLYDLHKQDILSSRYLQVDETTIKVLDENKKGKTHQGYYWLYHNSEQKLVLFDYRPGRTPDGPNDILKDFQGYLQTDGYVVYEDFVKLSSSILRSRA